MAPACGRGRWYAHWGRAPEDARSDPGGGGGLWCGTMPTVVHAITSAGESPDTPSHPAPNDAIGLRGGDSSDTPSDSGVLHGGIGREGVIILWRTAIIII